MDLTYCRNLRARELSTDIHTHQPAPSNKASCLDASSSHIYSHAHLDSSTHACAKGGTRAFRSLQVSASQSHLTQPQQKILSLHTRRSYLDFCRRCWLDLCQRLRRRSGGGDGWRELWRLLSKLFQTPRPHARGQCCQQHSQEQTTSAGNAK